MNYSRRILRAIVKLKVYLANRKKSQIINFILKNLTSEEILLINTVKELAIKNKDCIRFDVTTSETMIVLENKLITLKQGKVSIDNHHGFNYAYLPDIAYEYLLCIVHKEAHRDRRRLKFIIKTNLQEFLKSVQ